MKPNKTTKWEEVSQKIDDFFADETDFNMGAEIYSQTEKRFISKTKNFIKSLLLSQLEEIEKELVGRMPAFPPKGKGKEFAELKIFSVNDIMKIITQLKTKLK